MEFSPFCDLLHPRILQQPQPYLVSLSPYRRNPVVFHGSGASYRKAGDSDLGGKPRPDQITVIPAALSARLSSGLPAKRDALFLVFPPYGFCRPPETPKAGRRKIVRQNAKKAAFAAPSTAGKERCRSFFPCKARRRARCALPGHQPAPPPTSVPEYSRTLARQRPFRYAMKLTSAPMIQAHSAEI